MRLADDYQVIRTGAALGDVALRARIALTGADRRTYLHGLLTNDIQALVAGSGCYAAWLTPQGRMLTDMHVFELGDRILLEVPADRSAATVERLDQFIFAEDVRLESLDDALAAIWLHGPGAADALRAAVHGIDEPGAWPQHRAAHGVFEGASAVVVRVDQLGVPGFGVYVEAARTSALRAALGRAGAIDVSPEAIDAARIEAGYPVFGVDMTEETIPLEAGIETRAISFTKGCYVGQEVIIRVLHRGGGRVAKRLVGWRADAELAARGAKLFAADREVGFVTSAAQLPAAGTIGLGYVHRDFVQPDTNLGVGDSRTPAAVTGLARQGMSG